MRPIVSPSSTTALKCHSIHATAELWQPRRHHHHHRQPPGEGTQQPQEVQTLQQEAAQKQPQGQELALYRGYIVLSDYYWRNLLSPSYVCLL